MIKASKFILLSLLLASTTWNNIMAQDIIEIPITERDASIKWRTAERSYYSDIWATQVVTNVSKPSMEVFLPVKGTANGTAVIICPGGALYAHSINSEGNEVAKWLAQRGVTAFVLKYRLVPTGEDGVAETGTDGAAVQQKARKVLPLAVSDGLNAIQHVRENAAAYKVEENRIGLMGFSAGGAVTMGVTFQYEEKNKPNFVAPIYAWMDVLDGYEVPEDAPPMFVACASDDPLDLAPASVDLYTAWLKAGKSTELHMYAKGGHGFGMRIQNLPTDQWINRFGEWLIMQGWMK